MKPKVAYVVSRFPHLPETFILREMNELEAQGFTVELFPLVVQQQPVVHPEAAPWLGRLHAMRPFSGACLRANLRTLLKRPGRYLATFFQMIGFNLPSPKFLLRALFIFPVAVQMAGEMRQMEIQHVHAHYGTHPALAAWIIGRFTGIPYSITVHAHDIFVNRTMLRQKLKGAVFVRAISQFNKDFLVRLYGPGVAEKIHVIHCGIAPSHYTHTGKSSSDTYRLISVGSLQPYKGQAHLVEACALLQARGVLFHCCIVGGGELHTALQEQIDRLGLNGKVELAGPKKEDEVAQYLAGSDCFVLPSVVTPNGKMEGIPVVLMEALASELPVVASSLSGIPELIRDQVTGLLVPPGDAQAMAEKVEWLAGHTQEAEQMALKGRKLVEREFNIQNTTLDLANLFIQFQYQEKKDGR